MIMAFKQDCLCSNQTQYDSIMLLTDFEDLFGALALALASSHLRHTPIETKH